MPPDKRRSVMDNLEASPALTGVPEQQFDRVYCMRVLHQRRDIEAAIEAAGRRVRQAWDESARRGWISPRYHAVR